MGSRAKRKAEAIIMESESSNIADITENTRDKSGEL